MATKEVTVRTQLRGLPLFLLFIPACHGESHRLLHNIMTTQKTAAFAGRSLMPLLEQHPQEEQEEEQEAAVVPWEDVAFAEFVGEAMGGPPEPYTQRMVRLGDWKLNYYHQFEQQPFQLFNLKNDPDVRPLPKHRIDKCVVERGRALRYLQLG
jgi:arylsulfatase A-like enzyme